MPKASLTLVGTIHRTGASRELRALLTRLRPDVLTLEMSPYALWWRLERGRLLLKQLDEILDALRAEKGLPAGTLSGHPQVQGIRALLSLPFEYEAASAYAAETGTPLHLIDSSLISARKLRRVERELITTENLRTLLNLPPSPSPEDSSLARALVRQGRDAAVRLAFLAPRRGPEGIGERDRRMAAAIRRHLRAEGHLVHIGGWVHLVEDEQGETLYSRLQDLGPLRVLLD